MTISRSSIGGITALLVCCSLLFVHLLFWALPSFFDTWNAQIIDRYFRLRNTLQQFRPSYDGTIVHVDISDRSLQTLGNYYLTRVQYGIAVKNLKAMNVASQVWDFIFIGPKESAEDSFFLKAVREAGNVYFGHAFRLASPHDQLSSRETTTNMKMLQAKAWNVHIHGSIESIPEVSDVQLNFEQLTTTAKGTGFLNIRPDPDGVVRRVPLFLRHGTEVYPSIALLAICDYLGVTDRNIHVSPGEVVELNNARRPDQQSHNIVIPVDEQCTMVVNFLGPWEAMHHYDFADIITASDDEDEMEMLSEELSGSIALVAQVTTGSSDIAPTPTDDGYPLVGIHANVMNTILNEEFLHEIRGMYMFLIELILLWLLVFIATRFSAIALSLSILVLIVLYVCSTILLFLYADILLNVLRPTMMLGLAFFFVLAYRYLHEEKEKEVLRRSFESYFPPSVVKKIVANPEIITAPGVKKELTILFSDIKGFTTHTAHMRPDQIQEAMNEYFEAMIEIVFMHGGTVDKLMGDGLMVFFGDPEPQPDHALRCVRAAIDMQLKVMLMRERWVEEGKFPIQLRIGINTGVVVVGNMGSTRRLSYTALGADVNLAQRLEANAPVDGILISEATYRLVKDHVATKALGEIKVKGYDVPVKVYEVLLD